MSFEKENTPSKEGDPITHEKSDVVVYGTSWCGMSQMIRRYLEKMDIPYEYFDLEVNPDSVKKLRWITGGYAHHPTVVVAGQALIEPSMEELETVLERSGYV